VGGIRAALYHRTERAHIGPLGGGLARREFFLSLA
jgi:hypothetical protein